MIKKQERYSQRIREMIYISLFVVVMAVCSWIYIPAPVPFTLQTFGVFCALGILGGRRGTFVILIYVLLGIAGAPVFSSFMGGIGVLLNPTGGYIVGFVFSALAYRLLTGLFGTKRIMVVCAMTAALIVCYVIGTAWFMTVFARNNDGIGLETALAWCVLPFIIPDLLKIALAVFLREKLISHVKI